MVPKVGVEPTRAYAHTALNRARLPVSPLRHMDLVFAFELAKYIKTPCPCQGWFGLFEPGRKAFKAVLFLGSLGF